MVKKILVTGGSGFIGSNLVNHLLQKKYKVINLDKLSYSSTPDKFKKFTRDPNYKFIKVDLINKKKIHKIFLKHKPDIIFNLAAQTHVDRSIDSPLSFVKNNIESTLNLLEALKDFKLKNKKKIKLIHISTDEVYGSVSNKSSVENSAYEPNSPYAASKASSDYIMRSYSETYSLPLIVVNCCNNYGPYQFPEK